MRSAINLTLREIPVLEFFVELLHKTHIFNRKRDIFAMDRQKIGICPLGLKTSPKVMQNVMHLLPKKLPSSASA